MTWQAVQTALKACLVGSLTKDRKSYYSFAVCIGHLRCPCYYFVDEPFGEHKAYPSIPASPRSSLRYVYIPHSYWVATDRIYHPNSGVLERPLCFSSSSCVHPSDASRRRRSRSRRHRHRLSSRQGCSLEAVLRFLQRPQEELLWIGLYSEAEG